MSCMYRVTVSGLSGAFTAFTDNEPAMTNLAQFVRIMLDTGCSPKVAIFTESGELVSQVTEFRILPESGEIVEGGSLSQSEIFPDYVYKS